MAGDYFTKIKICKLSLQALSRCKFQFISSDCHAECPFPCWKETKQNRFVKYLVICEMF